MSDPEGAGVAAGLRHDDVRAYRLGDLIQQRGTIDRLRPRLRRRERDRPALHAAGFVVAEPRPLVLYQSVENRRTNSQRIGGGFAVLLVLDQREFREPRDLVLISLSSSSGLASSALVAGPLGSHSSASVTSFASLTPAVSLAIQSETSDPSCRSGYRSTTRTDAATPWIAFATFCACARPG